MDFWPYFQFLEKSSSIHQTFEFFAMYAMDILNHYNDLVTRQPIQHNYAI